LRAVDILKELEKDYIVEPNSQKLEISLTGLEGMLSDSIKTAIPAEQLSTFETEIKRKLKPYRSHMEKEVYNQTFHNLLLKRLREHFGVPRLSLFYL